MKSKNAFQRFTHVCKEDDSDFLCSLPNYHGRGGTTPPKQADGCYIMLLKYDIMTFWKGPLKAFEILRCQKPLWDAKKHSG